MMVFSEKYNHLLAAGWDPIDAVCMVTVEAGLRPKSRCADNLTIPDLGDVGLVVWDIRLRAVPGAVMMAMALNAATGKHCYAIKPEMARALAQHLILNANMAETELSLIPHAEANL